MAKRKKTFFFGVQMDGDFPIGHAISGSPIKEEDFKRSKVENLSASDKPDMATFDGVFSTFISVMKTYRQFIPVYLEMAPMLVSGVAHNSLMSYSMKHGVRREGDETSSFQLFELDDVHYPHLAMQADRVSSFVSGSEMLPNVMVIGLISAYDGVLSQLLKCIIGLNPESVLSPSKQLLFSDILQYSSVDELRVAMIEKEVETVIRKSHHDQFEWMEQTFKVELKKDLDSWGSFVELCERRNLFTHTDGVVSKQYIETTKKQGAVILDVKVGDRLVADRSYYDRSADTVFEMLFKLIHVFWRKMRSSEIKLADEAFCASTYDLIRQHSYSLAENLLEFGYKHLSKKSGERTRRIMVINLANSVRLQDRKNEAKDILSKEDWGACSNDFRISVEAIREDVDGVVKMMRQIGPNGDVSAAEYREWPVFRGMRGNEEFGKAFSEVFKEPLIPSKVVQVMNEATENAPPLETSLVGAERRGRPQGKRRSPVGTSVLKH